MAVLNPIAPDSDVAVPALQFDGVVQAITEIVSIDVAIPMRKADLAVVFGRAKDVVELMFVVAVTRVARLASGGVDSQRLETEIDSSVGPAEQHVSAVQQGRCKCESH